MDSGARNNWVRRAPQTGQLLSFYELLFIVSLKYRMAIILQPKKGKTEKLW